ncbi:lipopolysaccharide heptosyltransferase II [Tuwongella immobilis]|uniref:lipopolysaccharide heptosyltransferase II n=1 Tax=Tuwongella immobilis TaxID=692036 RepID=A0A6C2YKM5_9BACT|nr:lipopolysaccharide heptosyltransferase II [Tuwongella immobilis]VIP02128.1 lipopolysaccharide heptosyltransferase ii : Lipopolysaccharide heptosyltransferase II OS=Singulisphaera acidiphila (strain ATCC BAA-1392 / DSM 18658 / VKM B-2454 / MOB10) GN=Sinac_3093 PE=4 SV=1: Glyco_transf_9 [Tuwongella immobilis]VTS00470.1 lipopolysaccharide heptosyltransferase ii : Lipopolysaccharide heptosyltransferase II OS=Singulisphaera acidiphila (strain ATCC BAA-1392 / DSM 18658 / VKM B-2454 / MOB10) GN=Sinac
MKRLALFLPNWIGDVVMATPAIRAVRDHFPDAELIAVSRPYVAATMAGAPWFQRVLLFDKKGPSEHRTPGVAKQLRQLGVDAAILFPNSFRSALAAWLGGCKHRIGYVRYGRGMLLTDKFYPLKSRGKIIPTPIIDDYNKLVEPLGVPNPGHRMELFTEPADEAAADAIWKAADLRGREVIGLNPGAAFGAAKCWPTESFARLAQKWIDERGSRILVLCGPAERELARTIVEMTRRPQITSLADAPVSLGLTKACVRRLDLLITTDSGPRHFASAFARPVVALFGPTFISWTETYDPRAILLQKQVECGPCQLRVCPVDHRCMRELTPEEVYRAGVDLLAGRTGETRYVH